MSEFEQMFKGVFINYRLGGGPEPEKECSLIIGWVRGGPEPVRECSLITGLYGGRAQTCKGSGH